MRHPGDGHAGGRPRARRWVPTITLLVALVAAGAALAADGDAASTSDGPWHGVVVTDAQGWTLRGVSLYLADDGQGLVVVRADGAEKALAFADVARVLDAEGLDITDEVLTGEPGRDADDGGAGEPAVDRDGPRADPEFDVVSPRAQQPAGRGRPLREPPFFTFALEAGGGVADLTGDWFWGLEDGGFAQFGARLAHSPLGYLHLVYRHQQLGIREYHDFIEDTYGIDFTMQSFQLLLGHHTAAKPTPSMRALGYFEFGGGVMRLSASDGADVASLSRMAFAAQAGLWFRASTDLALDLGLHAFYKPGWTDDDEAGGTSLGLQLCLMYLGF